MPKISEPKAKVASKNNSKKKNLGENYGDENFQIVTEKIHKTNHHIEHEKNEIEKEISKLPFQKRLAEFSHNQYLIFFTILLGGIVLGTIFSFSQLKMEVARQFSSQNKSSLVSSFQVDYLTPERVAPNSGSYGRNGSPMNDNTKPAISTTTLNTDATGPKEFNQGKYKVLQNPDGSLVIVW